MQLHGLITRDELRVQLDRCLQLGGEIKVLLNQAPQRRHFRVIEVIGSAPA